MECATHEPRELKHARILLHAYLKVLGVMAAIMGVTTILALCLGILEADPEFDLYSHNYQAWVRIGGGLLVAASVIFGCGFGAVGLATIAVLQNWLSERKRSQSQNN